MNNSTSNNPTVDDFPYWILNSDLSDGALRTYMLLIKYKHLGVDAETLYEQLAKDLSKDENTVAGYVTELANIGAVVTTITLSADGWRNPTIEIITRRPTTKKPSTNE